MAEETEHTAEALYGAEDDEAHGGVEVLKLNLVWICLAMVYKIFIISYVFVIKAHWNAFLLLQNLNEL